MLPLNTSLASPKPPTVIIKKISSVLKFCLGFVWGNILLVYIPNLTTKKFDFYQFIKMSQTPDSLARDNDNMTVKCAVILLFIMMFLSFMNSAWKRSSWGTLPAFKKETSLEFLYTSYNIPLFMVFRQVHHFFSSSFGFLVFKMFDISPNTISWKLN